MHKIIKQVRLEGGFKGGGSSRPLTVTVAELCQKHPHARREQGCCFFVFFPLPENFRGQTELGQEGKSVSYPRV